MSLAAIWAALTSPLGRQIGLFLAALALLIGLNRRGYHDGQRDQAEHDRGSIELVQANLTQCRDNTAGLQASLAYQTAQVDAVSAESLKRLQAASVALDGALKGKSSAEARAAKLLSTPPAGIDACARVVAADRAVLESLK